MKWRNGLAALIGAWFIVAPWALHFSGRTDAMWASVVLGAIQLIASGWAAFVEQYAGWKQWQSWVSLVTGIWFIVQPFMFSLNQAQTWTSVILGAVTIVLHAWTMTVKETADSHSQNSRRAHA